MSKRDHMVLGDLLVIGSRLFFLTVLSVSGFHSVLNHFISGLPQGTILTPALFLLYINYISENIKSEIRLFVDDDIIYRKVTKVTLQEDLDKIKIIGLVYGNQIKILLNATIQELRINVPLRILIIISITKSLPEYSQRNTWVFL
jgi:hypothetical protein